MKKWIIFTFIFFLSCFHKLDAAVFVEPHIGGELGSWSSEEDFFNSDFLSGTLKGSSLGYHFGSKVYLSFFGAFIGGISYNSSSVSWNYNQDEENSKDDTWIDVTAKKTSISLLLGLQKSGSKGSPYKFWFAFGVSEKLELEKAHQPTENPITYTGTSLSGGFSLRLNSWFYINTELNVATPTKRIQNGVETDIPGSYLGDAFKEYGYTTFSLYISMPLAFFKKKIGW